MAPSLTTSLLFSDSYGETKAILKEAIESRSKNFSASKPFSLSDVLSTLEINNLLNSPYMTEIIMDRDINMKIIQNHIDAVILNDLDG